MVKLVLVAEVRPGLLANNMYPLPAVLMVRLLKVATPLSAGAVSVPPRPLPFVRLRVTESLPADTTFPLAFSTATCTAGEIVAWVRAFEGCTRKASFTGEAPLPPPAGVLMVKLALVAEERPELDADSV